MTTAGRAADTGHKDPEPVLVPVAVGELADKITILEIKAEQIAEAAKLHNIRFELEQLRAVLDRRGAAGPGVGALVAELKDANEALWAIEDDIRDCERRRDFGPRFIELARAVYHNNDRRADLKRKINELSGSPSSRKNPTPSNPTPSNPTPSIDVQAEAAMTTPMLGSAVRDQWALDWDWLHVNHGSFGAAPRGVLAAQQDWRRRMEAQPSWFMHHILPGALRKAAAQLGAFVGADADDIVFVENATAGCNAVLRSIGLSAGDEVLVLAHGYQAVRNAVRYVTERAGAGMTEAAVPFPRPQPAAILANIRAALTPRTRLAVIDHITSPSALVLPVAGIVAVCHSAGVPVLVDGAHGPAQIPLDLGAIGADWYVGNCHKWLCAPKGCGFLWATPKRQADLHPAAISHGFGRGFHAEFDWTGTADRTAFLCIDAAIDFHQRLGGPALMARNAALAAEATALLCERLDAEPGSDGTMAAAMSLVRVPLAGSATPGRAIELRERLLSEHADAPIHAIEGGIWMRISAHAYNEIDDYARLADILRAIC